MMFTMSNQSTIFTFWVSFFIFINTSQQLTPAENKVAQLELAGLAKETTRYGDMAEAMKRAAETGLELTAEEQNMLSFAYKSIVDPRRNGWLVASSKKEENYHFNVLKTSKTKIEKELSFICNDVTKLMGTLIKKTSNEESKIFYGQMKGDYHRYHAEIKEGNELKAEAENSRKAYQEALENSRKIMKATNTIRLGIAVKLSVLYNDVLNSPGEAYELANKAAVEAEDEVKNGETDGKEDLETLHLLEHNMLQYKQYMDQANGANLQD